MYVTQGLTTTQIGEMCGVSKSAVSLYTKKFSLTELRDARLRYRDESWLREMYLVRGMTQEQIGELCGVPFGTVSKYCVLYGLTDERKLPHQNREWLYEEFIVKGRTAKEIAESTGATEIAVKMATSRYGFKKQQPPVECECAVCGKKFTLLRGAYNQRVKAGQTEFYCSRTCSYDPRSNRIRVLRDLPRHVSEEQLKKLQEGNRRYFSSEEARQKRREWLLKALQSQVDKETSIERKIRERLEELKIPHTPQVPIGYYVVDFLLPETNLILEINGTYWHAHPDYYPNPSDSQRDRISRDKAKKTFLENRGYHVIYIWEHDINSDLDLAFQPVLDALSAHRESIEATA